MFILKPIFLATQCLIPEREIMQHGSIFTSMNPVYHTYCIFLYFNEFILGGEEVGHLFIVDLHVTASYQILPVRDLKNKCLSYS